MHDVAMDNEQSATLEDIQTALDSLRGGACWSVVPDTTTYLDLKIGEKVPLKRPFTNPHLTEEERNFGGDGLFVCCGWRLEKSGKQIAVWDLQLEDREDPYPEVEQLEGETFQSASLQDAGRELTIDFASDYRLHVYFDPAEGGDYTVFVRDDYISVDSEGTVTRKRKG